MRLNIDSVFGGVPNATEEVEDAVAHTTAATPMSRTIIQPSRWAIPRVIN